MANLHTLIKSADLEGLKTALANGADINQPGHCGATPLMAAIRMKDEAAFELLLRHGADPDRTNDFNETALHEAVQQDWPHAVAILIEMGMDLGRNPKYPLKEVNYDLSSIPMPAISMPEEMVGVIDEATWKAMTTGTDDFLDELGMNPEPEPVIANARSLTVLQLLLDAGERLEDADAELRRQYIGLPAEAPLECTKQSYLADRYPRFGTGNPERVHSPFMEAMVRCGGNAYVARQMFQDENLEHPVWCYDRHGHSLTRLTDGRFVGIAGEHEDHYDPDFRIYNDVLIHDGVGNVEIYLYPEQTFPPTDFHTATLVGNRIIIIGSLGYPEHRRVGETPVYQLDMATMAIRQLSTSGTKPGWISRHASRLTSDGSCIETIGGTIWQTNEDGETELASNQRTFTLDLSTLIWSQAQQSTQPAKD